MNNKELDFLIQEGEGFNLEFKENYNSDIAKEICAMANANGGKILIGVTDDGKMKPVVLSNKMKSEIQDLVRKFDPSFSVGLSEFNGIIIIDVPEGKKKPYSTGGKFYMRQGACSQQLSRDEIKSFFIKEGLVRFDEMSNSKFNFAEDFNEKAFQNFLKMSGINNDLSREEILRNLKLLDDGNLKNAGVLLFCKEATRHIGSATIICSAFQGNDKVKIIDSKKFDADLFSNFEEAYKFLTYRLNTEYIITGGARIEKLELPEKAIREAILNAIAHRDYFSTSKIQIHIFSDRVEINNPGGLVGNIKVEDLYKRSFPRNNLLFGLMQRMDLVEEIGSGLMRINQMMEEYLLPSPIIKADDSLGFEITFKRPDLQEMSIEQRMEEYKRVGKKVGQKVGEKVGEKLSDNQRKIIELIKKNSNISIVDLAKSVGIAEKNIEENLKKLKSRDIVKRIGPAKGGHWEIIER
ncbi:MAG: ATP-binding protein [Patescibacteria group bacterium]